MKQEILDCLQKESTVILRDCSLSKVFDALPFFQNIVKKGYKVKLVPNDNWFWSKANLSNRLMLMRDITFIKHFKYGDSNYELVLNNVVSGRYGIMSPVNRKWLTTMPDNETFSGLSEWLGINKNNPERLVYKNKSNFAKMEYCFNNQLFFKDFETWVLTEQILEIPINYAESKIVDGALYGDVSELKAIYMSKEYFEIRTVMWDAITNHRKNLLNHCEELLENYKIAYDNDNWVVCNTIRNEYIGLCQMPEGCDSALQNILEELYSKGTELFNKFDELPF
ncbi:MAG: hypothetical protein UGF89_12780 [Acutalibacteraceae bacterium]|nr:hypothetical protein [Acutalibacteraceae bacterium]